MKVIRTGEGDDFGDPAARDCDGVPVRVIFGADRRGKFEFLAGLGDEIADFAALHEAAEGTFGLWVGKGALGSGVGGGISPDDLHQAEVLPSSFQVAFGHRRARPLGWRR